MRVGMIDNEIKKALLFELDHLKKDEQRRVLNYARSLHPKGVSGNILADKDYGFEATDLEEMEKAIEEGCEKIDHNEW